MKESISKLPSSVISFNTMEFSYLLLFYLLQSALSHHVAVVDSFHYLDKKSPGLNLFKSLPLPDIVKQLSIR